jgi:hypothetical protein
VDEADVGGYARASSNTHNVSLDEICRGDGALLAVADGERHIGDEVLERRSDLAGLAILRRHTRGVSAPDALDTAAQRGNLLLAPRTQALVA